MSGFYLTSSDTTTQTREGAAQFTSFAQNYFLKSFRVERFLRCSI